MGMILHTIVVHDPVVVVAGGICPVRTCLVLSVFARVGAFVHSRPFEYSDDYAINCIFIGLGKHHPLNKITLLI